MKGRWVVGLAALLLGAGSALAQEVVVAEEPRPAADMRGLSVLVGAGIDGFTFDLAPQLNPGVAYNAAAVLRPTRVLGVELAYNGSVHEVDAPAPEGVVDGADLIRNGGTAALTLGLTATPLQPYLLAGVGISNFNFRGGQALGYTDDLVGTVPLGAGLRFHAGSFIADARVRYSFLFDQEFAAIPTTDVAGLEFSEGGNYAGTLNIGATF